MLKRPANAEHIDITPLYEVVKVPSKFLPGADALVALVACPAKCGAKHSFTCTPFTCECGLSQEHDISVVHVWREKEPVS